jgi:uncharacterized protein
MIGKLKILPFIIPLIFTSFKPVGYVNDFAGILSEQQKQILEEKLRQIEKETTNEICVLTIKSLEGKNLEQYANEIFNSWGIGKKEKDNGVLILIVMDERKIRIEVGYGLEPYLPDSVCGRIIREIMAPNFRNNDYFRGINEAVEQIDKITKGLVEEKHNIPPAGFLFGWFLLTIFFGFLFIGQLGLILEIVVISTLWTIAFVNKSTPMYDFFVMLAVIVPFFLIFVLATIGSMIFPLFVRRLKKMYGRDWKKHIPFYLRGSVFSSGSTSSHSGGFSGGFGGFGGGSSGGGGASGRW